MVPGGKSWHRRGDRKSLTELDGYINFDGALRQLVSITVERKMKPAVHPITFFPPEFFPSRRKVPDTERNVVEWTNNFFLQF